jgi:GntR family phosphonate transport system transcriptional regulator
MSRQLEQQPRYRELAAILAREVRSLYRPGDLLPGETQLAARFAVNRHTIRRAVDELVALGMLSRHQGRGTQVVDQRLDYAVQAGSRVSRNLAELGLKSAAECLDQQPLAAPDEIAACFGVLADGPLLCVTTLRSVQDTPSILLRHWFDPTRVPDWTEHYRGGSTRALLEERYGLRLRRRHVRIQAAAADSHDAYHLQCAKGAPLLQLISENVDPAGRLVEVSVSRARGDRLTYHFDFDEEQP